MEKPSVFLTYDLRVGADYLRFKEELAGTFPGMQEMRLLTSVLWDASAVDEGALVAYLRNHKEVADFIIVKGSLVESWHT